MVRGVLCLLFGHWMMLLHTARTNRAMSPFWVGGAARSVQSMAADFFSRADSLLSWLPGETLFSLCSRHHRLWGHGLSSRSTGIMFGGTRLGTQTRRPPQATAVPFSA